ncbi:MAG: AmmeMemoRadiSam system protein A [Candidatus Bipolaricaulota bacterium]|nr:AmmeMemoRadiSam system protein A [Candidatus Bipolaricaulota bacterium]MDW8126402.1 AmmeMemoRadiSam system protein A [Candidatus Bipolaricaulota bacterium]
MKKRDPYVELAWQAIAAWVREGRRVSPPNDLPPEFFSTRAGTFVSIKKHGILRGCIGTYLPTEENLAQEIIENAIRAATEDPRFPPVRPEELPELSITVDVLSPPETCSERDLDPKRYGVIVEKGWRRGLLLPDLPGVDTVEEQLRIAKMKAGLAPHEPCKIYRFTVVRHHEE